MPIIFVSHSHADKAIARRVVRRLGAYGVEAWLDERELRLGDVLDVTLRQKIEASAQVLVVATKAASNSEWVQRELGFATNVVPTKPICPLFVDDVQGHPLFANHLGLDACDPHRFERAVLKLAEAAAGKPLPPPDQDRLKADLAALSAEEPGLEPLIGGCLDGGGLSYENVETVAQSPFHSLDYAVNALYDVVGTNKDRVAYAAACLFARTGAGTYALERHLEIRGSSDTVLVNAVGCKLNAPELDTAMYLLSKCTPPDDQALAGFIHNNADSMTEAQRGNFIRLATHPDREAKGFAIDAAFTALRHAPQSEDLKLLWQRWIRDGHFDKGERVGTLAYWLGEAVTLKLDGWDHIVETFLDHVKELARSKDRDRVTGAVDHLIAAADRKSPLLGKISGQCGSALGAAEWEGWPEKDEMFTYVDSFLEAARTDRNWLRAWNNYEERWKILNQSDRLRKKTGS
jgi:hypothetical protein